jgi:hypothetical protein
VAALTATDEAAPIIVSDGMGPDTDDDDEDIVPLTLAEWHDADHPRGQPGNAGQFGPGGGSASSGESKSEPAKPSSGGDAVAGTADKWLAGADHLSAELRAKYHADLSHALAGMPDAARKMAVDAIDRGGAKFYPDVASLTQAASTITGRRERGVHGFVRPKAGGAVELHLDSGSETDPKAQYAARGTYTHELWHAVDADSFYSDKPKWQSAYKKDVQKGRTLLSRYAMESPSEGFAELGRVLQEKGAEHVRTHYPNCYKFLEAEKLL